MCANNGILFESEEHEYFFYDMMQKTKMKDVYRMSLFYCLGICPDTRRMVGDLYDFKTEGIKIDGLSHGWQTSGSARVTRLAYNLFTDGIPTVENYHDSKRKLQECRMYAVDELFCCSYAPYFFQAIKIRYPDYIGNDNA